MLKSADRVIVALDCSRERALELADLLGGHATWVKIGMTLYYACGPEIVDAMHDKGLKVFLDLKLHDIPHQIRGAAESASRAGADILSIHGLGGDAMVAAAREGVEAAAVDRDERTRLVSITVLTSMDQESLAKIGIDAPVADEVSRLATLACGAGSDGIVCSPQEAAAMLDQAQSEGIVRGFRTLVDWEKANVACVEAVIELHVSPKKDRGFDDIASAVAAFDEVESVLLMSGGYDLQVIVQGKNFQEIALFVAKRLSPLDDVLSTATHFVLRTYKRDGVMYQDEEVDERECTVL